MGFGRRSKDIQILVKLATSGNFDEAQKQLERLKNGAEGTSKGGIGAIARLKGAWGSWTSFATLSAAGVRRAFMTVLGPIGAIITIVEALIKSFGKLFTWINDYIKAQKEANETVQAASTALDEAAANQRKFTDVTGIENLKTALKTYAQDLKTLNTQYSEIEKKVGDAGKQWWNILGVTGTITQRYQEQLALLARQRQETAEQELAKQKQLEAEEKLAVAAKKREEAEMAITMRIAELNLGETEFKKLQLDLQLQEYEKAGASRVLIEQLRADEIKRIDEQATQKKAQEERKRVADAKKKADEQKKIEEERVDAAKGALTDLASFQSSKNRDMAAVGKAAASFDTMISAYAGAQKAFTALAGIPVVGPALGVAAAAAAIAAGLARVEAINATNLEEGGVTERETFARIGEKGKKEGVLPLENPRAMRMVGEAIADAGGLGGGGAKIENHFHGFGWNEEEFARRVAMLLLRQVRDRTPLGRDLARAVVVRAEQDRRRAFS